MLEVPLNYRMNNFNLNKINMFEKLYKTEQKYKLELD